MNNTIWIVISLLFLLPAIAIGQQINISEDPAIEKMIRRHSELNKQKRLITGWRVQVYATSDRMKLESFRRNFQNNFPYMSVKMEHEQPYYKLRVGAFSTKLEALRLRQRLKKFYPGAYPIRDQLAPEELI